MSDKQATADLAKETFSEMMARLGFTIQIKDVKETERNITLFVNTDEPGRLIGRKGKYLESAEHLLNSMLKHEGGNVPRVAIDVDGYESGDAEQKGERRGNEESQERPSSGSQTDQRIIRQAQDLAKEVKRWGEPQSLPPLAARDRRAVHVELKEEPGIRTESGEEDGQGRKVITIFPADVSPEEQTEENA